MGRQLSRHARIVSFLYAVYAIRDGSRERGDDDDPGLHVAANPRPVTVARVPPTRKTSIRRLARD